MALRDSWIEKREAAMALRGSGQAGVNGSGNGRRASDGRNMSQMHLARQGVITEEMQYVARREKLERNSFAAKSRADE